MARLKPHLTEVEDISYQYLACSADPEHVDCDGCNPHLDSLLPTNRNSVVKTIVEFTSNALRRIVDELFPGIAWDFLKEIKISARW